MTSDSDGPRCTEALLCEITGVSQSLRHNWIKRHNLRRQPRGAYEEQDAQQLAALNAILTTLGPADGAIAWRLAQEQLLARQASAPLVLLFDPQDKQLALASVIEEIIGALPQGRPIIAVRLDEPIARATRAFRLVTATSDETD